MFKHAFIAITLSLGCMAAATARSHYATIYNNFASLTCNASNDYSFQQSCLIIQNPNSTATCLIDSASSATGDYKYYARIANEHNEPGKTYHAGTGSAKVANTSWGIMFNSNDSSQWVVALSCSNAGFRDDIADKRAMTAALIYTRDGISSVVKDTVITSGVNLYTGFNVVSVEVKGNHAFVKIGDKKLHEIFSITDDRLYHEGTITSGLYIGSGALVKVERSVVQHNSSANVNLHTDWTKAKLDAHFAHTTDDIEGYWTYLDRDMEDKWLRIGGRYTIALVKSKVGYHVIYVEGAKVKKSAWHTGMLKGTLTPTIFTGNYSGTWIDATLKPITDDVYVTVENGAILCFKFPVYKSQLRFSKVIPTQF